MNFPPAQTPQAFSFRSRPISVPGDLRISWRVALIVLMLGTSRGRQASLAKLHVLNDAIRSNAADQLHLIATGQVAIMPWNLKVEPAFARAMDFVVGDKLAEWSRAADRTALKLSVKGSEAFKKIIAEGEVLALEKSIIQTYAKDITESTLTSVLKARKTIT
jgi:hypothetical protein